jgi:Skp family chaperone for outer membrane proteins
MRRATVGFVVIILGLFFFVSLANAADKIGCVDLSRLFDEYNKTKDYDKILEEKQKAFESERDKKVNEVKQIQDTMNLLSEKEKATKKDALEQKVKALQDFDRDKTQDLRKERDERMKEILKDIEKAVSDYAAKESYTLVFNDRVLVYQDKNLDITEGVLKILQGLYTKK